VLAQARGWAAKFLCIILIALIATLPDLLTEVFRTMSGCPAFGDPPSQETQPQMRAGYGS
jgi:predicted MFS family arabinose efflux permease